MGKYQFVATVEGGDPRPCRVPDIDDTVLGDFGFLVGEGNRCIQSVKNGQAFGNAHQSHQGGEKINRGVCGMDHLAGRNLGRVAQNKRYAHRGLVGQPLVHSAMLAHHIAMVRGEDHDGILDQLVFLKKAENLPNIVVDATHHPEILGQGGLAQLLDCIGPAGHPPRAVLQGGQNFAHGHGLLEGQVIVHGVVGSPHGIGPVGIRKSEHQTKGLFLVTFENIEGAVDQPIGGEAFLVRSIQVVVRLVFFARSDLWTVLGQFEFFPMPAIEHEAVVRKPELAGRGPTGLGPAVQVPLAKVGCRVAALAQDFGKGDDRVLERHVVAGRTGRLWIKTRNPRSSGRCANR